MMLSQSYANDNLSMRSQTLLKEPYRYIPSLVEAANANCFVFSMDTDGIIQYASENVLAVIGLQTRDMVGRSFDEFLSSNSQNDRVRNGCWHSMPKSSVVNCHCELLNSDHVPFAADMRCSGIFERDELVGLAAFVEAHSHTALENSGEERQQERDRIRKLVDQLSDAEREVVDLVVAGQMNKSMAKMLGVAVRTIEARRSRAMAKLQVRSLPDLVKTWLIYTNQ
jgi:RNA polymerase sigma factor (sigma-70 family)